MIYIGHESKILIFQSLSSKYKTTSSTTTSIKQTSTKDGTSTIGKIEGLIL
jgi:hypothetical protein